MVWAKLGWVASSQTLLRGTTGQARGGEHTQAMKRQAPDPDGAVLDADDAHGTAPRAAEPRRGAARGTEASARGRSGPGHGVHGDGAAEAADFSGLSVGSRPLSSSTYNLSRELSSGVLSGCGCADLPLNAGMPSAPAADRRDLVGGNWGHEAVVGFGRRDQRTPPQDATAYVGFAYQESGQGSLRHVSAHALGGTGLVNQECEPRPQPAPDDPDASLGRRVRVQTKVTLKKSSHEVAGQSVDGGAGLQVVHRILSIPLELDQEGIPVNNGYKVTMIMIHAAFSNELGACDPLQAST